MPNSQNPLVQPLNPRKINITVLGARGVGKTTLLTAMSDQFKEVTQDTSLTLTATLDTAVILADKKAQLNNCFDDNAELEVKGGIAGNAEAQDFEYTLGKTGIEKCIQVYFKDYPGGDITRKVDEVRKLIEASSVVLIAIDAAALVEEDGKWHSEINKPDLVTTYFTNVYNNLKERRLVIFVPVKCEKYMQNNPDDLLNRLKDAYKPLIDYFRKPEICSKVIAVVTPIQTLGNVSFFKIKTQKIAIDDRRSEEYPVFFFKKTGNKPNPQDCDQPLRYILRFLLKIHREKRSLIINVIRSVMGSLFEDKAFQEAAYELAKGCKTTGGFEILQNEGEWL